MKIIAYHRLESPEQRRQDAVIRAELATVRRWAQGLESLVKDRDLTSAARQAALIVQGLRTIERQHAA